MDSKAIWTILTIAATLGAAAFASMIATPNAYADSVQTKTDTHINQHCSGGHASGDSAAGGAGCAISFP
jgi:hypothetical protein